MKIGFLIITYGNNYLNQCVNSIREFYEDNIIYIIDNDLHSIIDISLFGKNIIYLKNTVNSFELGAIWCFVNHYEDIDKVIILHNSMILIEKFPNNILDYEFISFWQAIVCDYSPVVDWVEQKLLSCGIKLKHDFTWNSVSGCCCIINTTYLKKLLQLGFSNIYALTKYEAVGTEILFGYLIEHVLNIPNTALFTDPLDYFVRGITNYKYLKKIGSGQGSSTSNISDNNNNNNYNMQHLLSKINFTDLTNRNLIYKDLINVIDTNEFTDFQVYLTN